VEAKSMLPTVPDSGQIPAASPSSSSAGRHSA
jgi:hypothetical protein